mmetsp:Transcript_6185/g.13048  ORF Transcript_6185/g.13048 Transcript_6185/m.13048 type:complete len:143 (-) Transcript_6185:25-453(-)
MSWYSFLVMVDGSTVEASDVVVAGGDDRPAAGTERPGREVSPDVAEGDVKAEAPWCMDASMASAYCFGFETDIVLLCTPVDRGILFRPQLEFSGRIDDNRSSSVDKVNTGQHLSPARKIRGSSGRQQEVQAIPFLSYHRLSV